MDISATIKEVTKDWDIEAMVQAIIADDPEMEAHREELKISLSQAKNGEIGRITYASPIAETRHRANLTQSKFAERLGISLATLRSWEQGVRQPSGAAKTLLDLLYRKPELINDLHV
ncbi:MAG: helix-turn-helix domain-containing protein [[Pasteurella] mairii]|uniref:Putative transcriptional regulator n=1 Tax=[Pasteurella] mairii TaxID=757 RepID=A0A379B4B3_9PAST|nr:helix-turn-helix domain-containing protein [[Pasteurella] mairii]SUB33346.1 putative transcriptional regulator [[Pasteurella] mairii]